MPLVRTGVAYCEPKFQDLPVKRCQPLNSSAGIALKMSVTSTNTSISRGITAPPSPSQRIGSAFDRRVRNAPRPRRGGKPAPPSGCTVGAEAATRSPADRVDQAGGHAGGTRGQRLEADGAQVLGVVALGDDPVQE